MKNKHCLVVIMAMMLGLSVSKSLLASATVHDYWSSTSTYHGATCHSDTNSLEYMPYGARNKSNAAATVICPLQIEKKEGSAYDAEHDNWKFAYAFVYVFHSSNATTQCTLYSHDHFGKMQAKDTKSWTGTGAGKVRLAPSDNVAGGVELDMGSFEKGTMLSVQCTVPGRRVGSIIQIQQELQMPYYY